MCSELLPTAWPLGARWLLFRVYPAAFDDSQRIVFPNPRTAEYRASVPDIATYLLRLMQDSGLRRGMGEAGRKHVVELFDYRQIARRFLKTVSDRLGIQ